MVARAWSWTLMSAFLSLTGQSAAWPRVQLPDPVANVAIRQALEAASAWVDGASCVQVLSDFTDSDGRPLADRLTAQALDLRRYLKIILFVDDSRHVRCADGLVAFTEPGSRVVHVCSERLKETWRRDRAFAIASLIHEALHTLGLGENPPSPREITARVLARCAR